MGLFPLERPAACLTSAEPAASLTTVGLYSTTTAHFCQNLEVHHATWAGRQNHYVNLKVVKDDCGCGLLGVLLFLSELSKNLPALILAVEL